ncbi:MAG: leucine-rich repeat domain-containing protein [Candidatus Odinarchaeota archaeon]
MNKKQVSSNKKIILDLERIIKKPLDNIETVKWNSYGYELRDEKIIGIGLYGSEITTLPDSFWELRSLEKLALVDTRLTALSSLIRNFVDLLELYIGGNGMTTVPKEIGTLKKLKFLYILEEKLISLPHELGSLINLEELSIASEMMNSVPDSILTLKNSNCRIYLNNEMV